MGATLFKPLVGKSGTRLETAVPDGLVVTEQSGRRWSTVVHQASQLDGWQLGSETWLEARRTHDLVVKLASEV